MKSPSAPPNILMILVDDLGRCDYSACGTADIHTPHIDRICREGMEFENFFANSPVCSPSRASLLTGCYPDQVGVPGVIRLHPEDSWGYLDPTAKLLPDVLKPAGYETALIGKWHLGLESPNTPNERGFDFFDGFLGDMMDDYWTHLRHGVNFMRRDFDVVDPKGHATDLFTESACSYLEGRSGKERPFFLYLAYNAPHDPIQPPPEWLEKVKEREPGMAPNRQKLVALIEHLDAGIGQVLDTLDRAGLTENTIVIFNSDNGGVLEHGANNGPWRSEKGHVYDGGLRVPFAARWPGQIASGGRSARPALTMDIFATLAECAGIACDPGINGTSFLPTLLGETQPEARREHYFVRREGIGYGGKTIEALRSGDWKLLQDDPYGPLELYHVVDDPLESTDISSQEPELLKKLQLSLRAYIQEGARVPWQPPKSPSVRGKQSSLTP